MPASVRGQDGSPFSFSCAKFTGSAALLKPSGPTIVSSKQFTAQTREKLPNMTESNTITLISHRPNPRGWWHWRVGLLFNSPLLRLQIRINVGSLCRKAQLCQPHKTCSRCQPWWMGFCTFNKYKCHNPTIKFNKQKYHKPSFLSASCAPLKLITLEHISPEL